MVNNSRTIWARMNDGKDGRPTYGIKIVDGKSAWQMISLGETCDIRLLQKTNSVPEPRILINRKRSAAKKKVLPTLTSGSGSALFHSYVFADYSGAADLKGQKKSIKLAYAEANAECQLATETLTRDSLVTKMLGYLRNATAEGKRICFGFDHQFGVPFGLLEEIGLSNLSWREILDTMVEGRGVPALQHPSIYATQFNDWCIGSGKLPYFYSATKASIYGIPDSDPRKGEVETVTRLTERCDSIFGSGKPKPFNRVGDNGSVGGQTIMGLIKLRELLNVCKTEGIPVKCWPFDGLDIRSSSYEGSHVLIEPYPAAIRSTGVPYTDANDAIACVQLIQRFDRAGKFADLLDLSCLSDTYKDIVLLEGWIVGHSPLSLYGLKK
ncbi:MAG: hypothetical protein GX660_24685 [Clostridiaceae bacterium]|nr:hypothetical protein [Clostridiaceae bacterium]